MMKATLSLEQFNSYNGENKGKNLYMFVINPNEEGLEPTIGMIRADDEERAKELAMEEWDSYCNEPMYQEDIELFHERNDLYVQLIGEFVGD